MFWSGRKIAIIPQKNNPQILIPVIMHLRLLNFCNFRRIVKNRRIGLKCRKGLFICSLIITVPRFCLRFFQYIPLLTLRIAFRCQKDLAKTRLIISFILILVVYMYSFSMHYFNFMWKFLILIQYLFLILIFLIWVCKFCYQNTVKKSWLKEIILVLYNIAYLGRFQNWVIL